MNTPTPDQKQKQGEYSLLLETAELLILNKEAPIAVLPDKRGNLSLREIGRASCRERV